MSRCIICDKTNVAFNKREHIIPESFINNNLTIKGVICDLCNERFGNTLDKEFTNNKVTKARLQGDINLSGKTIDLKTNDNNTAQRKLSEIMASEERTAYNKGRESTTCFLYNSDALKEGDSRVFKANLEVKHQDIYLFALLKIAVEYLCYIAIEKGVSVEKDPVFRQICTALHEYTKYKKVNLKAANKRANSIWSIGNAGFNHDFVMPFYINGIWRKMSVDEYVDWASNGKRECLSYWLQIVNVNGFVGVLIVLGKIPPKIAFVGSKSLAYALRLVRSGQTIKENSKFQ